MRTLIADGQPRDMTAEGCTGWWSLEFALDGRRLFTRAERACEREPLHPSTGVIAMVSPREWIDVQATEVDGRVLSWVRRFRPARPGLAEAAGLSELVVSSGVPSAARRTAAVAPDVDDIIEASRTVLAEAVRAWVAELRDPFDLDSRSLLRLANAGVPASVIDVMIAVSYPDRLALQRDGDIDEIEDREPQPGSGYSRANVRGGADRMVPRPVLLLAPPVWIRLRLSLPVLVWTPLWLLLPTWVHDRGTTRRPRARRAHRARTRLHPGKRWHGSVRGPCVGSCKAQRPALRE